MPNGFLEFFAGGGMARIGLGENWDCRFANDMCPKKAKSYRANFPDSREFALKPIQDVRISEVDVGAMLAWASFPCQDLSLAGKGQGLQGSRSGTFWAYWRLMAEMAESGRAVPIVVLENVVGALTSNGGKDFSTIMEAIGAAGYVCGPLVLDAKYFLPQSRPRLFIIAVHKSAASAASLVSLQATCPWHSPAVLAAYQDLPSHLRDAWRWWSVPTPSVPAPPLARCIEAQPTGVRWHSKEETAKIIGQMSDLNRTKLDSAIALAKPVVGTVYRRTRVDADGVRRQRCEVRFDQVSGCLRTPAGGSSRQILLFVDGGQIRTRLISARECARLMGLPDTYRLPSNYNDAYHLVGDGLAVPVVRWLSQHLLEPLAAAVAHLKAA